MIGIWLWLEDPARSQSLQSFTQTKHTQCSGDTKDFTAQVELASNLYGNKSL